MTDLFAPLHVLSPATGGALGLALGFLLGLVHFASLRRVAGRFASGAPLGPTLALQLARFALMIAGLMLLARLGALPLIAGALGILIGRGLILRQGREAP